ncbi:hypothetical protein Rsub_02458 [Raphidocelis subcapitata]|uniref:Ferredoxin thioredoxin reductase alpha chain domain-containing protein n=1 Tax=Raphidocelis subcapitata TaxID=307507 RepID=A0A2V0NUK0_9CHLO|nr:hypothetical protein Rsub_02458 [Raphidocelis subcapitata]|eukprot:GBF90352.1 hypothetical protein Rsub_02458 [Raphidocelis subcapitata]
MGAGSYGGDHFAVHDAAGRVYFMQAARSFSARDRRVLLDASGAPCVGMAQKMLSLKPTWLVYRGGAFDDASLVAQVKSHFTLMTPSVSVYLNDGDTESDFKLRGDFRWGARRPAAAVRASADNGQFAFEEGAAVRVVSSIKVFHVPKQPEVELEGMTGTVKKIAALHKGQVLSANLQYRVQFATKVGDADVKFFAHLAEEELEAAA